MQISSKRLGMNAQTQSSTKATCISYKRSSWKLNLLSKTHTLRFPMLFNTCLSKTSKRGTPWTSMRRVLMNSSSPTGRLLPTFSRAFTRTKESTFIWETKLKWGCFAAIWSTESSSGRKSPITFPTSSTGFAPRVSSTPIPSTSSTSKNGYCRNHRKICRETFPCCIKNSSDLIIYANNPLTYSFILMSTICMNINFIHNICMICTIDLGSIFMIWSLNDIRSSRYKDVVS